MTLRICFAALLVMPVTHAADTENSPQPLIASAPFAAQPEAAVPAAAPVTEAASSPAATTTSNTPVATPRPTAAAQQAVYGEKDARALLTKLLPKGIADRAGWSNDIYTAFTALKIPYTPSFYCASIAVIAQESTFQSDPVVPGLPTIVWGEIDKRIHRYGIPRLALQAAFIKKSPDGRSYNERIDALRTERQMNALFEDMLTELPFGQQLAGENPIRTGGPMQVGVDFSTAQSKVWPYPYKVKRSLRDEVFTRRGSVYFGTAHLLQYQTDYTQMVYRFADYNAGRYASRNAAMQAALATLSKQKLKQDGYLMSYNGTMPTNDITDSQRALFGLAGKLGLSQAQIQSDLKQERYAAFAQTPTYTRFYALAEQVAGKPLPREALPQIKLVSPKITRKLTTEWFAKRVDGRYQDCLKQIAPGV